jgi:hypothetical protein
MEAKYWRGVMGDEASEIQIPFCNDEFSRKSGSILTDCACLILFCGSIEAIYHA